MTKGNYSCLAEARSDNPFAPDYYGHSNHCLDSCGDGMSSVTKQVKKYRNRLKIRDFERFAAFGSLLESLFSCFDNSVIVWVFV